MHKFCATLFAGVQIEITIPRPFRTLLFIGAVVGVVAWLRNDPRLNSAARERMLNASLTQEQPQDAQGGNASPQRIVELTGMIMDARARNSILERREELLRYQVEVLQRERERLGPYVTSEVEDQFRQSVEELTILIKDQKKAEQFLMSAFMELWEAEGRATELARQFGGSVGMIALEWPVEPAEGISAYFLDKAYKARFGFEHYAVDIPVPQGTVVTAAADGVVKDVVDNGLGYNYITIQHSRGGDKGFVTIYGHINVFHVSPGMTIRAGQIIGRSGGRPGTPGAGFSTGPHLHFGVRDGNGASMDPLQFLPPKATIDIQRRRMRDQ